MRLGFSFKFGNWPLRHKLALLTFLTMAGALSLSYVAIVSVEFVAGWNELRRSSEITAESLANSIRSALLFDDHAFVSRALATLKSQSQIQAAALYRSDGSLFASYRSPALATIELPTLDSAARFGVLRGASDLAHPVTLDDEILGTLVVRADLSGFYHRLGYFAFIALLALMASTLAVYPLWLRLQHIVSDPMEALLAAMRQVAERQEYDARVAEHGGDEFGQLVKGFNQMLEQIQIRDRTLADHRARLEEEVVARTRDVLASHRSAT